VAPCDNSTPPEPVLALMPTAPRAERGGQDDGSGGAEGVALAACTTLALAPSPKRRLSFPTISGGDAQDEDARPNAKYVKTRAGIVGGTCTSGYNPSTDQTSDPIPGLPKGLAKPGRLPIVLV
jgi:hypothetical protein